MSRCSARVSFLVVGAMLLAASLAHFSPEQAANVAGWGSAGILRVVTPYHLLPGQEKALAFLRTRFPLAQLSRLSGPILTGEEVLSRHQPAPGGILVYTPWELRRLPGEERGKFLLATTQAAVRLGVRVVVEASAADGARLSPEGKKAADLLRVHGILRVVLFDGAHHLPGLRVPGDVLLLPVMRLPGERELVAVHGYIRDALPVSWLQRYVAAMPATHRPVLVLIPRFGGYLKAAPAMGQIGRDLWALLVAASARLPAEGPDGRCSSPSTAGLPSPSFRDAPVLSFFGPGPYLAAGGGMGPKLLLPLGKKGLFPVPVCGIMGPMKQELSASAEVGEMLCKFARPGLRMWRGSSA